ncbi:hypothetical protein F5B17DRAFT_143642 [Nemania serpens]|nr:hypothetical protein F5B17DRAFT_143642 [Nemania serpens]
MLCSAVRISAILSFRICLFFLLQLQHTQHLFQSSINPSTLHDKVINIPPSPDSWRREYIDHCNPYLSLAS